MDIHQCYECADGVQIFPSEEALLTHKWDAIRASRLRSHMRCHICQLDHRTFAGLVRHYQLNHPAKQRLACPGCAAPFDRLYLLMSHLDGGDCPRISREAVQDSRERQVRATHMLAAAPDRPLLAAGSHAGGGGGGGDGDTASQSQQLGIRNTSGVPVGDYGLYLGLDPTAERFRRHDRGPSSSAGTATATGTAMATGTTDVAAAAGPGARAVQEFRRGDAKVPDLLTDDTSPASRRAPGLDVWAGQAMLAAATTEHGPGPGPGPARGPARGPTRDVVRRPSPTPPARAHQPVQAAAAAALGEHDPSHPDFNVHRYRDPFSGRYNCPSELCKFPGKQFKTAAGLVSHLRSSTAHATLRLQCPSCFGLFGSIEALMQHCESQSSRCHFRESEEYLAFLRMLTAGVADVQGRHMDMTVSYAVQPDASKQLESTEAGDEWAR